MCYMLLGQAYFQMGDYDAALEPIKKAVDMDREQGNTPKENWLLLLRVIYYEKQDFKNMIAVLEELIQYYPKDTYLLTLAGAHSELGDTLKQLVIVETLYEKGLSEHTPHTSPTWPTCTCCTRRPTKRPRCWTRKLNRPGRSQRAQPAPAVTGLVHGARR